MANKRNLKKNIIFVTNELFCECVAQSLDANDEIRAKADKVLGDILSFQSDFISRVNQIKNLSIKDRAIEKQELNKIRKGKVDAFFKQFNKEFGAKVNALVEAVNNLK